MANPQRNPQSSAVTKRRQAVATPKLITVMNKIRLISFVVALNAAASLGGYGFAQTIDPKIRPDIKRALSATPRRGPHKRANSYRPTRSVEQRSLRPHKNETES